MSEPILSKLSLFLLQRDSQCSSKVHAQRKTDHSTVTVDVALVKVGPARLSYRRKRELCLIMLSVRLATLRSELLESSAPRKNAITLEPAEDQARIASASIPPANFHQPPPLPPPPRDSSRGIHSGASFDLRSVFEAHQPSSESVSFPLSQITPELTVYAAAAAAAAGQA